MTDTNNTNKSTGFWDYAKEHPGYTLVGVFLVCSAISQFANDAPLLSLSFGSTTENTIKMPDCDTEKSKDIALKGNKYTITCQ